jgi:DNA-binding Lrp family transcriptional regulator
LLACYSDLIIDCHVATLVSVSIHEKTFFTSGKSSLLTFTEKTEYLKIDTLSKKILQELYFDSRKNIATIAEKLHTTVDMVRLRMLKLEEQRVIIRYTAAIDYQKLGYEFYKASIYLKKFDTTTLEEMMKYAEESKVIINIVKQITTWDLEFVLFARSFKEYNDAIGAFTTRFKHAVKKIDTAIMSEDIIFPCSRLPL